MYLVFRKSGGPLKVNFNRKMVLTMIWLKKETIDVFSNKLMSDCGATSKEIYLKSIYPNTQCLRKSLVNVTLINIAQSFMCCARFHWMLPIIYKSTDALMTSRMAGNHASLIDTGKAC